LDHKIAIYLSLGLHKGCTSYRRSLQLSKEKKSSTLKRENALLFSIFVGHFCPPGSGSGSSNSITTANYKKGRIRRGMYTI
jgi:hypothetical protein